MGFKYDRILNKEIKSSDDEITDWLKKNSSGKTLGACLEFNFILDNKNGVCCKKIIVFDSTKTNLKDLTYLILKLTDYPEFKQFAQNSTRTNFLSGMVYYDKSKNEYKIALIHIITEN